MSNRAQASEGQRFTLLAPLTITAAVGATGTTPVTGLAGAKSLTVQAKFTYGSGGTTAKVYVQTTLDGGVTWIDIMCLAFTTATATKVSAVVMSTALGPSVTPTDGALADNTILSGLFGDQLRLKYVTTGTYGGGTTLSVSAIVKG